MAHQKIRNKTENWNEEEIPEYPLMKRMLLGADSGVQSPRLRAYETDGRSYGRFSGSMDPVFVNSNAAMMQCTQFA